MSKSDLKDIKAAVDKFSGGKGTDKELQTELFANLLPKIREVLNPIVADYKRSVAAATPSGAEGVVVRRSDRAAR